MNVHGIYHTLIAMHQFVGISSKFLNIMELSEANSLEFSTAWSTTPRVGLAFYTRNKVARSITSAPLVATTRYISSAASPERVFQDRVQEVRNTFTDPYPRLPTDRRAVSCADFRARYAHLGNNETVEEDTVVVHGRSYLVGLRPQLLSVLVLRSVGRIRTNRLAGSKLIFFDLVQDGHKVQAMCNLRQLEGITSPEFKKLYRLLRRGDAFCRFSQLRHACILLVGAQAELSSFR